MFKVTPTCRSVTAKLSPLGRIGIFDLPKGEVDTVGNNRLPDF